MKTSEAIDQALIEAMRELIELGLTKEAAQELIESYVLNKVKELK